MDSYALTVSTNGGGGAAEICGHAIFPAEYIAFRGHFPGHPILPGFMHIQLALDCLRAAGHAEAVELREITTAKFVRSIAPGEQVQVDIAFAEPGVCDVVVSCGADVCSRFTLMLR